jgi:hypothetical protein
VQHCLRVWADSSLMDCLQRRSKILDNETEPYQEYGGKWPIQGVSVTSHQESQALLSLSLLILMCECYVCERVI